MWETIGIIAKFVFVAFLICYAILLIDDYGTKWLNQFGNWVSRPFRKK